MYDFRVSKGIDGSLTLHIYVHYDAKFELKMTVDVTLQYYSKVDQLALVVFILTD